MAMAWGDTLEAHPPVRAGEIVEEKKGQKVVYRLAKR